MFKLQFLRIRILGVILGAGLFFVPWWIEEKIIQYGYTLLAEEYTEENRGK